MMKILIDSGCDLPKEIIERYNIEVLPLIVYLDDKEYFDGVDIQPKEVYDAMRNEKVPKTAQITMGKFQEVFKRIAESKESYIYIAFSSELSGTYQTSILVKEQIKEEYTDLDLEIIDSKNATLGVGLIVQRAAQMVEEGKSKEEIIDKIKYDVEHLEQIFTVDNLEYLFRGGRISKTAAVLGGLLNIKPVLDVEEGKLIPLEKVRGKNKLLKRMIQLIDERGKDLENQVIGIGHGDDLETAHKVKEIINEKFGVKDVIIHTIGSAIGAHSGPGTIAISFFNEPK